MDIDQLKRLRWAEAKWQIIVSSAKREKETAFDQARSHSSQLHDVSLFI